ncbi:MAG: alternate F1F0 ATPase, F1 subunit alpha [Deltaproteobacteria bacterium]|nr:alternate F1F0 ATPase, F1 subunit alpha [Deltaproteobacteria bacterium]
MARETDSLASWRERLDRGLARAWGRALADHPPSLALEEVGRVAAVQSGVVRVEGLSRVRSEEMLVFPGGILGVALDLHPDHARVVLLDEAPELKAGQEVRRTRRVLETPVGETLLGRVVDALGRPLDRRGPVRTSDSRAVERPAPAIMDRAPVTVPLQTGLKVVDAMIPVGRGQRELILGDRQTGKTALALDAILNQRGTGVICIYCAVGKRVSAIARLIDTLEGKEALAYSIVVASSEEDPPGLVFYTPYAATSMAEHFMEKGRDVLVVYDDLTRHAWAYREISLLLRRPPGREAYPGDIFYIHSRLLERSTHLAPDLGGGSLTALPIIETQAGNIAAYIPTNLVSITDGQIYLSPRLFQRGVLPAVDVGKSVSRVGGKTQLRAFRDLAGDLRLSYSQFEELEGFARFGTRLDQETRARLERGRRVRTALQQAQYQPVRVAEQVAVLAAVNAGLFDPVDPSQVPQVERAVRRAMEKEPALGRRIEQGESLSEENRRALEDMARRAVESWRQEHGPDH